jgi:hypothetical protein
MAVHRGESSLSRIRPESRSGQIAQAFGRAKDSAGQDAG